MGFSGLDTVPAAIGLLLFAAVFDPLLGAEIETGPSALGPMGGTLDPVLALGAGDFGRNVHPCRITGWEKASSRGFLSFV